MTITIECGELTVDEQLALAGAISDGLAGDAVALIKDEKVVIDPLEGRIMPSQVETIILKFIARRKDATHYSLDVDGEDFVVHSPDPLSRSRGRRAAMLPNNVLKCPYCSFVTPYQEAYDVHVRSHGFGVL